MKKIFTLVLALMGFASVGNAETIDDVAVCKHSYVLKFEDHLNNGAKPGKGKIFGDGFFLDVTGGTIGTKGAIDLADENFAGGAYIKYAEYGKPSKTWRLKNGQDVIAMKVTAKSKIIILGESHASRGPQITDAAPSSNKMQGNVLATSNNTKETGGVFEWVADDDRTIYIGSDGGDYYVSYLIVEANEAPGTPTVKVSEMKYDAVYFKEVTCKANPATEEGSTEQLPTIVTYTTDGSKPTAASPVYSAPIICTKDMTVKFQAFLDLGDGKASDDLICDGADNEGIVSFIFDAPVINADGGNVSISTGYNNATNYYSYGEVKDAQGDSFTLTEGATVTAYTVIDNGDVKFTSKATSKDIYQGLLAAVKEKKTIAVSGTAIVDDEATATSTTGTIYKVDGGAITAESKDFFVKNLTFGAIANADANNAKYQAPAGQEAYIKMSDTNITFFVASGEAVKVKVVCSKNSCKTLNADNDESVTTDRKCYVQIKNSVDGKSTTYGNDDVTAENGNIIEFELKGGKTTQETKKNEDGTDAVDEEGNPIKEDVFTAADAYFTFEKYSGTGNILISSIEITPADPSGIAAVKAVNAQSSVLYNLAGQRVDANYKGIVVKNGAKMIQK